MQRSSANREEGENPMFRGKGNGLTTGNFRRSRGKEKKKKKTNLVRNGKREEGG